MPKVVHEIDEVTALSKAMAESLKNGQRGSLRSAIHAAVKVVLHKQDADKLKVKQSAELQRLMREACIETATLLERIDALSKTS